MTHNIPNITIDGQSFEDALHKTKTKLKAELKLQLNKNKLIKNLSIDGEKSLETKKTQTPKKHTIKQHETLTSIAKHYQVTIADLIHWNKIKDINLIYEGNMLIVSDPIKSKHRSDFETYKPVEESSGWLFGEPGIQEMNVTNGAELALASLGNYDIANITGDLLEKIKTDAGFLKVENKIISKLQEDPLFKKKAFYLSNGQGQVIELGGKRWSAPNEDWSALNDNNPIVHKETWDVGLNQLTWALRHATLKYWAEVTKEGRIKIEYRLFDRLDLSPSKGRSPAYNLISEVLGFGYHTVAGGNINLQTRAKWSKIIE